MGTVWLSFGSPTSGAGFNVSSTVAEIVGNLQNVETPWKNQLTKLESQDTAISSLGTLFSSLTNDISAITDFQGILAQKTGSSSDTNVLTLTAADNTAVAGTHTVVVNNLATTSSGYLVPISNAADSLSGAITLKVGASGTPQTITLNSSNDTLAGLAAAINASGAGVTASVLKDSSGSRLSLVSGTSGAGGTITVSANSIVDTSNSNASLAYSSSPVVPKDANLTVDGVDLTSSSNTVTNLIPGVTFQLLAPSASESDGSLEPIQVVIGNDNTGVESTVNQMVSDYNAVISAMNTQEGLDTSGNAEPLFGSPTLSLLQQQLLAGLNLQNPNGELDPISTTAGTTLSGSISIAVGSGQATTIDLSKLTDSSLSGVAAAINAAKIDVTATIVTRGTQSTLSLLSQTAGPSGALTVNSNITASGNTALTYSNNGTESTEASGTIAVASGAYSATGSPVMAGATDTLSGSISIQAGTGTAQTIVIGSAPLPPAANTIYTGSDAGETTLSGLSDAINNAKIGVTASVVTTDGNSSIKLVSSTSGTAGDLIVTSDLYDTSSKTSSTLDYNNSSDLSTLANLGITVSSKDDGSLVFDATTLDSTLNSDYSSVVGFFQNASSWGQSFSTILNNAGTGSSAGALSLASSANSNTESTLNADVSKEESLISAQQKILTAELNSANEIMQELPSQLEGVNELYSAITGYNQNANG